MIRKERFALVLTEFEKSLIEQLAELEGGLSRAALLRRLIHKAAREHNIPSDLDSNDPKSSKSNA